MNDKLDYRVLTGLDEINAIPYRNKLIGTSEFFSWVQLNIEISEGFIEEDDFMPQPQLKGIQYLKDLHEKNQMVYDNELISEDEYMGNILLIRNKLKDKMVSFLIAKKKKASKLDLYSLRAGIKNLDNEN
ncbi:hypothetical protein [Chryseobacterium sp.]|uniref:hypothetical protein n=1 Tax=Chryseobacterium sp. TaxID=1871047 RepID=UPI0025BC3B19|nr:hypothetical protein [Chryseobacterium sp.]MBV8327905.1 hypothetical protein [Chryseobacterium sp.]